MSEPIAIIGAACRFPGRVTSLEKYWTLLEQGVDAVTCLPPDRCSLERFFSASRNLEGHAYTRAAGVVDDIQYFDADFFGISRKECQGMDPQQRLALETAWEALESALIVPSSLKGSQTGVYMGSSNTDMSTRNPDDPAAMSAYTLTGVSLGIIANRISYLLDLHGPSMTIDTACSSSLVAVHQACEALRAGRVNLAIAGGVNALLVPHPFIGFSQAHMLSPDGRCKSFDASGNGYVRSEGAGAVILKPLSRALKDKDAVLAVIAGSGVNSDGRTTGISLPNAKAQAALLRDVYNDFNLDKAKLAYLEAHGTGTAAGDPIEAAAIGAVFGKESLRGRPLLMGSVKANIGHLEPAAGMAGLLKGLLVLRRGKVPPNIHFTTPNPAIDFARLNLTVPTRLEALPDLGGDELVSVNSFGFGGTNAHVVLQKAPRPARQPLKRESDKEKAPAPLLLSANSLPSLGLLAGKYAAALEHATPADCYDTAATLAVHRERMKFREIVTGATPAELCGRLKKLEKSIASGEKRIKPVEGAAKDSNGVFVFTGNGSQWCGMGAGLLRHNKEFKAALEEVDALLAPLQNWSLLDIFANPEQHAEAVDYTEKSQPLLFAVQVGLVRALKARGIVPAAVFGHSVGEVAAAWACDALSLEDAVTVIHYRSSLQKDLRDKGGMAVVSLPEAQLMEMLRPFGNSVQVAAINTADSFTLAGDAKALRAIVQRCKQQRGLAKMLNLPYPFHTDAMDAIQHGLIESLKGIRPRKAKIPFFSTAVPEVGRGLLLDNEYWWNNIRRPVLFHKAAQNALRHGFELFMEIGPRPLLASYLRDISREANRRLAFIPTLTNGGDEKADFSAAWKTAWQEGWKLDAAAVFPLPFRKRALPSYPWNREYLWVDQTPECREFLRAEKKHPLLGWRLPGNAQVFENVVSLPDQPWLGDHKAGTTTPYPAAAFIEGMLAAGREMYPREQQELERVVLRRPLQLSEEKAKVVRTSVDKEDGGVVVEGRGYMGTDAFSLYARGRIMPQGESLPEPPLAVSSPVNLGIAVSSGALYETARSFLLNYGPAFQTVEQAWVRSDHAQPEIFARLAVPVSQSAKGMLIAPTLLDGAFQTLFILLSGHAQIASTHAYLPAAFDRVVLYAQGIPCYAHVRLERVSPRSVVASFRLADAEGNVLLCLRNCRFRRAAWLEHEKNVSAPYAVELEPAPHPACISSLESLSPQDLGAALEFALKQAMIPPAGTPEQPVPPYHLLQMAALAAAHESVLSIRDGKEVFSPQTLIEAGLLAPEQEHWFCRMLERLEEVGLAFRVNGHWQVRPSMNRASAQTLWRTLASSSSGSSIEALLLAHVFHLCKEGGLRRSKAVEADILPSKLMEAYFGASSALSPFSDALVRSIPAALKKKSPGQRITVLQLGRDSAGLLARALPHLRHSEEPSACRYVVAEKSPAKAEAVSLLFDKTPGVEFVALDLEAPAAEHKGKYHMILLACSLHEYENSALTLKGCLDLLAPGGMLCLLEHAASMFTDYVFGANPWWWKASRERGLPVSLLQPRDFWEEQMLAAGFTDVLQLGTGYDETCPGMLMLGKKVRQGAEAVRPAQKSALLAKGASHAHSEAVIGAAADSAGDSSPCWLLLTGGANTQSGRLAEELRSRLQKGGAFVLVTQCGEDKFTDKAMWDALKSWDSALQEARASGTVLGQGPLHVAYLCGYSATDTLASREYLRIRNAGISGLAALSRAWDSLRPQARLWIVTGGALSDDRLIGIPAPSQGALAGFARVLMNEMRWLPVTLLDLHGREPALDLAARELLQPTEEPEVVLADGVRYVPRLSRIAISTGNARETAAKSKGREEKVSGAQLNFDMPGRLQNLHWQSMPVPSAGKGQVCIEVRYTGLNFRDVMWSMGMLLDEALENGFSGPTMGLECSGVIVAVGKGVTEWAVGDEVIGFAPACFSTHVVTTPSAITRKPANIGFAEAATIPVCFFTAWYSLNHLARLQPGERVLIHGAAGGVGLAAVQIAAHLGLEVYATAGAPEKHRLLRQLGVRHIFSSRSLSFVDEVMKATDGQGVDCVLNSLAGEAISAGLSLLKPFGRFIELGKRDFYDDTPMRLRPFSNNLSYFGVDVDQMLIHQPALSRALFAELMDLFTQRKLVPLPHTVYQAPRAVEAFQAMQQSAHVGKLVVSLEGAADIARDQQGKLRRLQLPGNATYLITGGADGFGLATAQRLARRGAKHLLLVSRSGIKDQRSQQAVDRLRAEGVEVIVARADVTNAKELKDCIGGHCASLPPLRGVVHAAAALDDKTITGLTPEHIHTALAAKALGAWNLHAATFGEPLDFFVLYSSATTAFGNPGQAGYVAANCMLETLAHWRRRQKLPASVIGWGPIGDTGMITRNPKARAMLLNILGVSPTNSKEALYWLEHCIACGIGSSHFFGLDWHGRADLPALAGPRLSRLRPGNVAASEHEEPPLERIRGASREEALEIVGVILVEACASVLRVPKDRLSVDRPLALQGMDSLMVVELTSAVEKKFELTGYTLPFSDKATAASLAASVYASLTESDSAASSEQQALASLEKKHDMRFDDELREALLK